MKASTLLAFTALLLFAPAASAGELAPIFDGKTLDGWVRHNGPATFRAEHSARSESWTSEAILKLYPFPMEESPLKNLISRVYHGEWQNGPAFTKLKAENMEEERDGFIRLGVAGKKEKFGIVWEGDFMATAEGGHEFFLDADDGAHLVINGKTVAKVSGIGGMNGSRSFKGKAGLAKGANSFRLEYFEYTGEKGVSLGWKGPGMNEFKSLTPDVGQEVNKRPVILPSAAAHSPRRMAGR
jgi:hypothetical protein